MANKTESFTVLKHGHTSHQDQYGRRKYLTISLPQNNTASICTPIFQKGMFYKVVLEYNKKQQLPLSDNNLCHH